MVLPRPTAYPLSYIKHLGGAATHHLSGKPFFPCTS